MNAAALKIQSRWRIKQGKMALHLKRQAKADREREDGAQTKIAWWWRRLTGNFAERLKARAVLEEKEGV